MLIFNKLQDKKQNAKIDKFLFGMHPTGDFARIFQTYLTVQNI